LPFGNAFWYNGDMAISSVIRDARERLGLSQSALASEAGVSAAQISRLESGERSDPSFETIVRLAGALHVSVDEFAEGLRPNHGVTADQWHKAGFDQVDEVVPGRVYEVYADGRFFRISITRAIQRGSTIEWNSSIDELISMPRPDPDARYDNERIQVWSAPLGIPARLLGDSPTNALLDAMRWLSDWGGFDAMGHARRDAAASEEMEPTLRAIVDAIDESVSDLELGHWRDRDRAKWSTANYDTFVTRGGGQLVMMTYFRDKMKHAKPVVRLPLTRASVRACVNRIREIASEVSHQSEE
jgi:transcriptional regulator with XRE-family HTH domain